MASANEYRQFYPNTQMAPNPAEQYGYEQAMQAAAGNAYEANQLRQAAEAAWKAQQNAAGANTFANVTALKDELARNQSEIVSLQAELATLTSKLGDQDDIDRKLAANRARIGDLANSRAHQQDIQNRVQWRWQSENANKLDNEKQKKADLKALVDKLDSAYSELAFAESESQKQVAQSKVNRLRDEYKEMTGNDFVNPFDVKTGMVGSGDSAKTLEAAKAKYEKSFDKNGRPTQAAVDEFLKDLEGLTFSAELSKAYNEARNAKTQEQAKKDAAKEAKKNQDAVDAITAVNENKLVDKDSYTTQAPNGRTVTITRQSDGTYEVKCGNAKKIIG